MKDINDGLKWNKFCEQLISMTEASAIQWEDATESYHRNDLASRIYYTEVKGRGIIIYKQYQKYWHDEERFEWEERIKLEILDQNKRDGWLVPQVAALSWLWDHILFTRTNAQRLLDTVLGEGPKAQHEQT